MSAFSFLHGLRACLPCVMCLLLCRGDMFVLVPCIPLTAARVLQLPRGGAVAARAGGVRRREPRRRQEQRALVPRHR